MEETNKLEQITAKRHKKDWVTNIIVFITFFEILAYLIFYAIQYFVKEGRYIPGTFLRTGFNIPFMIISLLTVVLAGITIYILTIKTILVFKNIYSRNHIKTSISSIFVTFFGPVVISSAYIFIHTAINVFVLRTPGAGTVAYVKTVLFLAPILFLIVVWLFNTYRKQEVYSTRVAVSKRKSFLQWILAIISTLVVGGIIFGSQNGLEYFRTKEVKRLATEKSIGVLGVEKEKVQPVNINLTKAVASDDNFGVTLEWSSANPAIKAGTRLLVIYSNDLMNYSNPYGERTSSQLRSSCTAQRKSDGNYLCYVRFSSSLPGGGLDKKGDYIFFIDKSVPGNALDRDEKRKSDLKKLQTAFFGYYKANGRYPCADGHPCPDKQYFYLGLPLFDWKSYQDPLYKSAYRTFSSMAHHNNIEEKPPAFITWTRMELPQHNTEEFFCVDSDGNAKIITKQPNLAIYPYSCNNLQPD
jgi:hypothetical protein